MTREDIQLLQKTQLMLMRRIHKICMENGVDYYLVYGSALGAKRHGGFIPWDLDIDIGMMRGDYDKFREVCKTKLDSDFEYHDYNNTKNYFAPHALVTVKNTTLRIARDSILKNDIDEVFIDIFPIDEAPADKELQMQHAKRLHKIRCSQTKKCGFIYRGTACEKIVKRLYCILMSCVSFKSLGKKQEKEMRRYENCGNGLVCCMASYYPYMKQVMPKEFYGKPQPIEFEGETFFVPEKLHEYLTTQYGDYNTLPPEEDRQILLDYFKEVSVSEAVRERIV